MYDIIVIGAGVTGTCTARELSKYQVNMCVIDKGDDVASGTSKANSGIVHGGYDCKPGTLMAEMNVRGNELLYELAEDLDYPIKKNGSLIVCTVPGERGKLDVLLEQAKENGVPGCRIIDKEEALKMEPNLTDNTVAALYVPTGGIICPWDRMQHKHDNPVPLYPFRMHSRMPDGISSPPVHCACLPEYAAWNTR